VKRLPIVATIIVALSVAVMIALGVWQLQRANEKDVLIARFAANRSLPPRAFPSLAPIPDDAMFRNSNVTCLRVVSWQVEGGQTPSGKAGYRHIASCATAGAEGPGALIDMGISPDPAFKPQWTGGSVEGIITTEPEHRSLLGRAFGKSVPLRPMLVADKPAPGLAASNPPDPSGVPNNHRGYAVQWFLFAAVALVVFGFAVRQRKTA